MREDEFIQLIKEELFQCKNVTLEHFMSVKELIGELADDVPKTDLLPLLRSIKYLVEELIAFSVEN